MTPLTSPTPLIQSFIIGSTGWIVLNRAERRNSLNAEMWAAIPPLMKTLDGHADVRAIVIRGAGAEAFASGADISEFDQARNDATAAARYERLNGEAVASIRGGGSFSSSFGVPSVASMIARKQEATAMAWPLGSARR